MSDRLAVALRAAGFDCRVEARERLAILAGIVAPSPEERERIVGLARAHGYSHVALEVTSGARAPLPRGQS